MPLQEVFPAEKTGEKRMKIDKISLKNEQAWVTFRTDEGEYIGTLHIVEDRFLEEVKSKFEENPRKEKK